MKDFLRLLRLHRPRRGWMLLGLLLALLTLLANLGLLALSGWFIASMALAGLAGVSMNYFTPAAMIRACAILRTSGRWGERVVTHEATLRLLADLRVWLYQRIEPLAPAGLEGLHRGDLLNRLSADIDRLDNFYLRILLPIGVATLGTLILIGFVARYSIAGALVLAGGLLLVGALLPWATLRAARPDAERLRARQTQLREQLLDNTQALAELSLYGALPRERQRLDALDQELHAIESRHERLRIRGELWAGCIAAWSFIALVLITLPAFSALGGAQYAMLAMLSLAAFESVASLPFALQLLPETLASARRLFSLADRPLPVREPDDPLPPPDGYRIEIVEVGLRYPERSHPALQDISLTVEENASLAIVGASGAGKSSLLQLLLRFREYDSGEILLGGTPLRYMNSEALRGRYASLSQHSHLFNASIRDNLLIACPDAGQEALDTACRQARILDLIQSLPQGYDTWTGEAGTRLSGGERRRLALARTLLKPAPILLLDEPTEGLDPETEDQIIAALSELRGQRSLILVTHKPALLRLVDRVVLLDQGRLLAAGSHTRLLAEVPTYRDNLALPELFSPTARD